jgi:hypothetical protein
MSMRKVNLPLNSNMKIEFNSNSKKYELSDRKGILDSDKSLDALRERHGIWGDKDEEIIIDTDVMCEQEKEEE